MRRDTAWAAKACGLAVLLCASEAAAAGAAPASSPGRFTITRTLPDGRTEVRSVTLEELKAMSRPASPKAVAANTVVFELPPPIPDRVAPASPPAVLAVAAPVIDTPARPAAAHAGSDDVALRRTTPQAPSAAAIRVATASRTAVMLTPLTLSGGWTLLNKEPSAAGDDDGLETDAPARVSGASTGGKRKGARSPLGVRDGRSFGEQGRFYLYAGVKNRGVGLNLTDHNGSETGGWGSDGVSYDKGGFGGQRSAGLGWRQGDVATSLGWVHEKNNIKGMYGAPAEKDDRVAVTFSWRPSVK